MMLMLEDSDCSEEYWKNVYLSVGFEMPQIILKVLREFALSEKPGDWYSCIWSSLQKVIKERDLSAKSACNDVSKFQPVTC